MQISIGRRSLALAAVVFVATTGASAPAWAQASDFPTRPITLIVPFPAGGSTDRHMRTLADIAGKQLGQTIIVENKPGAGGTLGPGNMSRTAKPDGYTITQFPMSMLRMAHMQKTAWNPVTDFTYIIGVSGYTFGFTVRSDSPYKSFNEYIAAARKSPGKIEYGSTGIGSSPHLLMEELAENAKVTLNHVPFKGNADLQQALLGGHVAAQSDASGWDTYVDGGQMRLLMTLAVVRKLHDAFKKAMDDPRHIEVLKQLNQDAWYRSGADYAQWVREAYAKDKVLIDRLGLAAK